MKRFEDKVVVVTGGTTGIGFAAAQAFVAEGATVVITGTNAERLDKAQRALSDKAQAVKADQTDPAALNELAATLEKSHGRVDVLFANAGVTWPAPIEHIDAGHVRDQFVLNFEGPLFTVQTLLPMMGKGAAIVFTTSCLDQMGMPGMGGYAATKAALRSLTRTLAAELKERGIRVNAVAPGPVQTPIYSKLGLNDADLEEMTQGILGKIPMGRFGGAEEVASAALYLASPQASFITGEELFVDGGMATV
nr:SDR family oxidoreductase [uncultured Halomonas sp.]